MKPYAIRALAAILSTTLGACGTLNNMTTARLKPTNTLDSDEAILVVGNPARALLGWDRVQVLGGTARPAKGIDRNPITENADTAHAIFRVKDVDKRPFLGLVVLAPEYGRFFTACGEAKIPFVELKPGEIVYVGDISVAFEGKSARITLQNDEAAAHRAVAKYFPDRVSGLITRELSFLPTGDACPEGPQIVTIPIYLPPRR